MEFVVLYIEYAEKRKSLSGTTNADTSTRSYEMENKSQMIGRSRYSEEGRLNFEMTLFRKTTLKCVEDRNHINRCTEISWRVKCC